MPGREGTPILADAATRQTRRVTHLARHRHPVGGATSASAGPGVRAFRVVVAAVLAGGVCLPASTQPQPEAPPTATVARVVAGIVSYTRWPDDNTSIRLCTLGRGPAIEALQQAGEFGAPGRRVTIVAVPNLGAADRGCQAVYLGRTGGPDLRQAVRLFAGRPILLLGEGTDFCSEGGMFCIEPASETARFGVNLDAVARSGLRVNPQVLRIARGGEGQGS